METTQYNDLQNCNFCKTILMLCVVLGHSAAFFGGTGWFSVCLLQKPVIPLGMVAWWVGTFHVACFTFISGYIYYYLRYEQGKYAEFVPFLKNKAKRLLVPYIAMSVLWVIPISHVFDNYSLTDILMKYGLGSGPAQLWFLLMLFGVFMIAYKLIDNKSLVGGVNMLSCSTLLEKSGKLSCLTFSRYSQPSLLSCTFGWGA